MKISKLLTNTREDKNLTQEQLGEEIGVSNKKVSRWEKGDFNPSLEELKLLSLYYEMTIAEIVGEKKETEEEVEDDYLLFICEEVEINTLFFEVIPYGGFVCFISLLVAFAITEKIIFLILIIFVNAIFLFLYFACHFMYKMIEEYDNYQ